MASGPEHYAEAERLIKLSLSSQEHVPEDIRVNNAALWLGEAQVHATLALAAATAANIRRNGLVINSNEDMVELRDAWGEVIGNG